MESLFASTTNRVFQEVFENIFLRNLWVLWVLRKFEFIKNKSRSCPGLLALTWQPQLSGLAESSKILQDSHIVFKIPPYSREVFKASRASCRSWRTPESLEENLQEYLKLTRISFRICEAFAEVSMRELCKNSIFRIASTSFCSFFNPSFRNFCVQVVTSLFRKSTSHTKKLKFSCYIIVFDESLQNCFSYESLGN